MHWHCKRTHSHCIGTHSQCGRRIGIVSRRIHNAEERINIVSGRIHNAADALALYQDAFTMHHHTLALQRITKFNSLQINKMLH